MVFFLSETSELKRQLSILFKKQRDIWIHHLTSVGYTLTGKHHLALLHLGRQLYTTSGRRHLAPDASWLYYIWKTSSSPGRQLVILQMGGDI